MRLVIAPPACLPVCPSPLPALPCRLHCRALLRSAACSAPRVACRVLVAGHHHDGVQGAAGDGPAGGPKADPHADRLGGPHARRGRRRDAAADGGTVRQAGDGCQGIEGRTGCTRRQGGGWWCWRCCCVCYCCWWCCCRCRWEGIAACGQWEDRGAHLRDDGRAGRASPRLSRSLAQLGPLPVGPGGVAAGIHPRTRPLASARPVSGLDASAGVAPDFCVRPRCTAIFGATQRQPAGGVTCLPLRAPRSARRVTGNSRAVWGQRARDIPRLAAARQRRDGLLHGCRRKGPVVGRRPHVAVRPGTCGGGDKRGSARRGWRYARAMNARAQ